MASMTDLSKREKINTKELILDAFSIDSLLRKEGKNSLSWHFIGLSKKKRSKSYDAMVAKWTQSPKTVKRIR